MMAMIIDIIITIISIITDCHPYIQHHHQGRLPSYKLSQVPLHQLWHHVVQFIKICQPGTNTWILT